MCTGGDDEMKWYQEICNYNGLTTHYTICQATFCLCLFSWFVVYCRTYWLRCSYYFLFGYCDLWLHLIYMGISRLWLQLYNQMTEFEYMEIYIKQMLWDQKSKKLFGDSNYFFHLLNNIVQNRYRSPCLTEFCSWSKSVYIL